MREAEKARETGVRKIEKEREKEGDRERGWVQRGRGWVRKREREWGRKTQSGVEKDRNGVGEKEREREREKESEGLAMKREKCVWAGERGEKKER